MVIGYWLLFTSKSAFALRRRMQVRNSIPIVRVVLWLRSFMHSLTSSLEAFRCCLEVLTYTPKKTSWGTLTVFTSPPYVCSRTSYFFLKKKLDLCYRPITHTYTNCSNFKNVEYGIVDSVNKKDLLHFLVDKEL